MLHHVLKDSVGDITDEYDKDDDAARREVDEVDGLTTIEEFAELTGYVMPEGPYDTVAGFFMAESGQVPALGSTTTFSLRPEENPEGPHARFTLEVSAVDGRRVELFPTGPRYKELIKEVLRSADSRTGYSH